ncbi:hypothetical protein NHL50_15950 [Acidimicrobiia bacterium EGI L10123]|uniref:hypothetical protein n=1 Tax=Salinilacustrithrix flava TaxID=2957203 RepID=UPI003D7C22A0|nr:hypothetical protein [Acidimicrobiia bacterium EGI L10123]
MTADKTPLEDAVDQALDAFVYAPIGLLFDGPARLPKLIANGRNQVTNARMMGQFAVRMGRTEVNKRAASLDGPVVDLLRGLGVVDGPPPGPAPAPAPTPVPDKPAAPAAKEGSAKAPAPKKPAAAKKATRKASAKKAARKATKQAPKKVAATTSTSAAPDVAGLAIPDYDSLSASQVVSRLQGLSTAELEAVRSYEAATRGRKTILNRVQQLQKP